MGFFVSSRSTLWSGWSMFMWQNAANVTVLGLQCSIRLVFGDLSVSTMYDTSQSPQGMWYTGPTTFSFNMLSSGWTNNYLGVFVGLKYVGYHTSWKFFFVVNKKWSIMVIITDDSNKSHKRCRNASDDALHPYLKVNPHVSVFMFLSVAQIWPHLQYTWLISQYKFYGRKLISRNMFTFSML